MPIIDKEKQFFRKKAFLELKNLQNKRERSKDIIKFLTQLPEFYRAKNISFYINTKNEVYSKDLISKILSAKNKDQISRQSIYLPFLDKTTLSLCQIKDLLEIERNRLNVMEPKRKFQKERSRLSSIKEMDIAIIPGLLFDENGYRLGRGKGLFDMLLQNFKKPIIALAFDCQIIEKLPRTTYDIPMTKIITEKRILELL